MRKYLRPLFWTTLTLGIVGTVLRIFILNIWVVPGDDPLMSASITPTLAAGDVVVIVHAGHPTFGELARCVDPDEPSRFVIGRIAGEPGDEIAINNGRISLNNRRVDFERACLVDKFTVNDPVSGDPVEMGCSNEALGTVVHKTGVKPGDNSEGPFQKRIEPGTHFLVSDNRAFPADSRLFGSVRQEACDARIVLRLWSAKGFSDIERRFDYIK